MTRPLRVDQILPCFSNHDAIGAETLVMRELLRSLGFASDIFAEQGYAGGIALPLSAYAALDASSNILLHHFSIGSIVPYMLLGLRAKVITRYHNITPVAFIPDENAELKEKCREGLAQLPLVAERSHAIWADSAFNAADFKTTAQHIAVLPILRNYRYLCDLPAAKHVTNILAKTPKRSLLFVGRVTPSKAQHDLLFYLAEYRKLQRTPVQLLLAGRLDARYAQQLQKLAGELGLHLAVGLKEGHDADVVLCGEVSDSELAALYRGSAAFVSTSEHEGFGVPLVEAMAFGLPLLAHPAAAIPETVGQGGLLCDKEVAPAFLRSLAGILEDERQAVALKMRSLARAADFNWQDLKGRFKDLVNAALA